MTDIEYKNLIKSLYKVVPELKAQYIKLKRSKKIKAINAHDCDWEYDFLQNIYTEYFQTDTPFFDVLTKTYERLRDEKRTTTNIKGEKQFQKRVQVVPFSAMPTTEDEQGNEESFEDNVCINETFFHKEGNGSNRQTEYTYAPVRPDTETKDRFYDLLADIEHLLTPREKECVKLYCEGYDEEEIGIIIGKDQSQVSRCFSSIKNKYEEEIGKNP